MKSQTEEYKNYTWKFTDRDNFCDAPTSLIQRSSYA